MAEPKKSFFQRHPGFDLYSLFWFLLFLILAALGRFFLPLWIPAAVVLVYLLIRLLSKNQEKRQVENARFLALSRSAFRWFRRKKQMQTDTQYYYFRCPTCGQSMRLPRGGEGRGHLPVLLLPFFDPVLTAVAPQGATVFPLETAKRNAAGQPRSFFACLSKDYGLSARFCS